MMQIRTHDVTHHQKMSPSPATATTALCYYYFSRMPPTRDEDKPR